MPLKKLTLKPGVNRENTRYTSEGGWYECDKVRFRQGTPEKIGGWQQISNAQFQGVCRSLWTWAALDGQPYVGLGTNLKYYIAFAGGGAYNDVTPIRETTTAGAATFAATNGSSIVTVTDNAHGCQTGDFVTFSGAVSLGGNVTAAILNAEFQVTVLTVNTYTITVSVTANASDSGNGGASVVAAYQVNTGSSIQSPISGWGGGAWGAGTWGVGTASTALGQLRTWNAQNFGQDLIFGPRGGALYYWSEVAGLTARGVLLSSLSGASDVPLMHNELIVSDTSRFVLAFGCNDYGSSTQDPMLIRWSDQESAVNWTPAATNQAGSLRLSHGSAIQAVAQVRQEIFVWSDTSVYSLQYLGAPVVWGSQLLSDNTSIISDRAYAMATGVTYWMGYGKFYIYDGRVQPLNCDLRQYIFSDINFNQSQQIFAGTNEQFNEIWWFYCSVNSNVIDRYVIFNYMEKVWYYGNLGRTSWVDTSVSNTVPIAADYNSRLLYHETGVDDNATQTPQPIEAYITSAEFDIDDGHNFGFVWRVLPDMKFIGSTAANPQVEFSLLSLQNSGSGYNNPESVAGSNSYAVVRTATVPVEQYTGQVNIRIRGRQMSLKVASDTLGTQWQLGAPRLDIKPDGRKS